jgi:hypothetical protein
MICEDYLGHCIVLVNYERTQVLRTQDITAKYILALCCDLSRGPHLA